MVSKNTTEWNRQDRDLLIKLETKLDGVVADIKDMRDSTLSRLSKVEAEKLDRTEANRLQSEALEVHTDHEERLRVIEENQTTFRAQVKTYGASAVIALGIIEFLLNFFHPMI